MNSYQSWICRSEIQSIFTKARSDPAVFSADQSLDRFAPGETVTNLVVKPLTKLRSAGAANLFQAQGPGHSIKDAFAIYYDRLCISRTLINPPYL
ncbi:MAG: hypothetical protein JO313_06780 [Verrucomicrobia bacterium]|nr:hypothetical protein [Verrucomicrobiota bacterium]